MRSPRATAFGSFRYGWQQLWKYFLHLFLIGVVVWIAGIPTWGLFFGVHDITASRFIALNMLATGYLMLVMPVIKYGADWMYLRFMRDERPNVADIFQGFKQGYLNIVLANLLVVAIVGIGIVLLVVPGLIFATRLSFVPYLVMDKGLDPVSAIEKSWFMTRGHGWRIFGMYLLSILLVSAGLVLLVFPGLFALMWSGAAFSSLYHAVDLQDQAQLNQNGVAA